MNKNKMKALHKRLKAIEAEFLILRTKIRDCNNLKCDLDDKVELQRWLEYAKRFLEVQVALNGYGKTCEIDINPFVEQFINTESCVGEQLEDLSEHIEGEGYKLHTAIVKWRELKGKLEQRRNDLEQWHRELLKEIVDSQPDYDLYIKETGEEPGEEI